MNQPVYAFNSSAMPVLSPVWDTHARRRRYPLLSLHFKIRFFVEGRNFLTEAFELSDEATRLSCPAAEIPLLVPRTAHHRPNERIIHGVELLLDDQTKIRAQLQVQSCRRYSQQAFHVGFTFAHLEPQDHQRLAFFLERALANGAPYACMFG